MPRVAGNTSTSILKKKVQLYRYNNLLIELMLKDGREKT